MTPARFRALWQTLLPIGQDPAGDGWLRYGWSEADLACRAWFTAQAQARGLQVTTDRNGNLYAWWGDPAGDGAVVTGSHFDSVPHGGAYDGPLGIVSGLLAVDLLAERGVTPHRPLAVAAFAEEEGSRFGVACLGSRLLTGALDPAAARKLTDPAGVSLADAVSTAGLDPAALGPEPELLARWGYFIELHVEQGRALVDRGAAVGVASAIWPHGRWRIEITGEGNHAGTTAMADRHDPMLTTAYTVLAANKEARLRGGHATVGRIEVAPNATNAVPARVTAWLDARAPDQQTLTGLVEAVTVRAQDRADRDGTAVTVAAESVSPVVDFDVTLRDRLAARLGDAPVLPTGAGHDAGVLSGHVPTAMLFVRNPTGVSHAPGEHATDDDCAAGVVALADVLAELACQ
ncbi:allantoate amidohydrolase [Natronosporangium hydrolyticum]|uniref:Allantoate amidohydrolase n=1 Tax=Natronosporangium hydrolyticum TaxID=2811111 RepID=A0A895Y8X0_9ACTN|nr:allantoate amidohydrolase [Natronosporangium hydrolyticum]QSB13781.1 allantoate amidohydrolase [Natronosporangium hydrolyticum]